MAETNDELLDYEEQEDQEDQVADGTAADAITRKDVRGTYVSIHSSGFRDFLLKPELLRAIVDCGFEHPSEGLFFVLLDSHCALVSCASVQLCASFAKYTTAVYNLYLFTWLSLMLLLRAFVAVV